MWRPVLSGLSLLILCSSTSAFMPSTVPASARGLALGRAFNAGASSCTASSSRSTVITMSSPSSAEESDSGVSMGSRRRILALAPSLVAGLALASPDVANAIQAPAKVQTPGADGFINLDGYVQHAVIACRDLDDEVEFWTKGVGMRVLRSRTVNGKQTKFLGYGPETLKGSAGGHFALEITEADKRFEIGTGLQHFDLELPSTADIILKIEDAGGSLIPRWFGTSNFIEASSPSGYKVRINPVKGVSKVEYPFKGVTLRVDDMDLTSYFFQTLGLQKQDGGFNPFAGDGTQMWRFTDEIGRGAGPVITLEATAKDAPKVRAGNAFKLAVLASNVDKVSREAKTEIGATEVYKGKAPGTDTQVSVLEDTSSGYVVAVVDYNGFEKEMPKAPKAPSQKKK